jgi:hypothetical protein
MPGRAYIIEIKTALTKLGSSGGSPLAKQSVARTAPALKNNRRKGPSLTVKRSPKTHAAKHRKNRRKAAMAQRWKNEFSKLETKQKQAEELAGKEKQTQERKKAKERERAIKLTDTSHVDTRTAYEIMEEESFSPLGPSLGAPTPQRADPTPQRTTPMPQQPPRKAVIDKIWRNDFSKLETKQEKAEEILEKEKRKQERNKAKERKRAIKLADTSHVDTRTLNKTMAGKLQRAEPVFQQPPPVKPKVSDATPGVKQHGAGERIQTPETQSDRIRLGKTTLPRKLDMEPFLRLELVGLGTAEEDRVTPRENTGLKTIRESSAQKSLAGKGRPGGLPAFIDVYSTEFTIGRSPHNSFQLDSIKSPKMLSKVHAKIEIVLSKDDNEPKIQIRDMKSTNGTYINGKRVKNKPADLFSGALLKLGRRRTSDLVYKVIVPKQLGQVLSKIAMYRASSPIGKIRRRMPRANSPLSPSRARSPSKSQHRKKMLLRSRGSLLADTLEFPRITPVKAGDKGMQ